MIYTTTDIAEARAAYDASMDALIKSNATYYRFYADYEQVSPIDQESLAFGYIYIFIAPRFLGACFNDNQETDITLLILILTRTYHLKYASPSASSLG